MKTFGERVKERRKEIGLTQYELAEKTGLTQSIIASIESRNAKSSKYLSEIAITLGVSERWLVTGVDDEMIADELEKLVQRFFLLFKEHQIPQQKIPTLLGGGLTLSMLGTKEKLLNNLTECHFRQLSELFFVNYDWVIGYSDNVYTLARKSWYKSDVYNIAKKIMEYKQQFLKPEVIFIVEEKTTEQSFIDAKKQGDNIPPLKMGVIIKLTQRINGVDFYTYDLWKRDRWNYSKCRLALKTIMLFCKKNKITFSSRNIASDDYDHLYRFNELGVTVLSKPEGFVGWYPEDFISNSEYNSELDELNFVKEEYRETGLDKLALNLSKKVD